MPKLKLPFVTDKNKEYFLAGGFFFILTMIFFYRIFLGEVYSPVNLFYNFSPWNNQYTNFGVHGELLSDPLDALLTEISFIKQNLIHGEIPFWMNQAGLGAPIDMNIPSVLFFPTQWIYLLVPLNIAPTIDIIVRFMICQMGMYVMLRSYKMGSAASIIGAIIYNYSMPMIVWLNWPHTKVGMLAPWLLWSVKKLFEKDYRFIIITAILVHWMLVIGMPAYAAYFFYIVSFYYICLALVEFIKTRDIKGVIKYGYNYAIPLVFGLMLSMPYFLPFFKSMEFTKYLEKRANSFHGWKPDNLLHFFDPQYYTTSPYSIHFNEMACYFGVASAFLLICSFIFILYKKQKDYYFFVFAEIVLFVCIFSIPGSSLIGKLPLINSSAAFRMIMPFIFVAAILVAKCVDLILHESRLPWRTASVVALICLAGAFAIGQFYKNNFILSSGLLVCLVVLLITVYMISLFMFGAIGKKMFIFGLVVLFCIDLLRGGINYNPSVIYEKSSIAPKTDVTDFLIENSDNGRFISFAWTLFPNTSALYGINSLSTHSLMVPNNRLTKFYRTLDDNSLATRTNVHFRNIKNYNLAEFASNKYVLLENINDIYYTTSRPDISTPNKIPAGNIYDGVILTQEIKPTKSFWSAIFLLCATYDKELPQGTLICEILDESGKVIRQNEILNSEIKNNEMMKFAFEPIEDSKNKKYTLVLSTKNTPAEFAPTVWLFDYDQNIGLDFTMNGEAQQKDFIYQMEYCYSNFEYIDEISGLYIYEDKNALPRAYLTGNIEICKEPDTIVNLMANSQDKSIAFLEETPEFELAGSGVEDVQDLVIKSNSVTAKTNSEQDKLFVLTDLYYPGWKVYVDGIESKIIRTNYLFRGVFIPKGEHTVKFVYTPHSFYIGIIIYIISLIILLIYWRFVIFKRKNDKD